MNKEQLWIKCKNKKELNDFIKWLKKKNFNMDFCDDTLAWPIIVDNELKVAFSVDKPSYCGAYLNSGKVIMTYEEYVKRANINE